MTKSLTGATKGHGGGIRISFGANKHEPSNPKKEVNCTLSLKYGKYRLEIEREESYSATDFYECLAHLIDYSNKDKGISISLSMNAELPEPQKRVLEGIVSLHNQKCYSVELTRKLVHPH